MDNLASTFVSVALGLNLFALVVLILAALPRFRTIRNLGFAGVISMLVAGGNSILVAALLRRGSGISPATSIDLEAISIGGLLVFGSLGANLFSNWLTETATPPAGNLPPRTDHDLLK
jgi:hypothetical protein